MDLSLSGVTLLDLKEGSEGSGVPLDLKLTSLSLSSLISCLMSGVEQSWERMKSMPKLSLLLLVLRSMVGC